MKIKRTKEVVDDFYINDEDVVKILEYYKRDAIGLDNSEWFQNDNGNIAIYTDDHYGHDMLVRKLTTAEVDYFNAIIIVRNFIQEKLDKQNNKQ